MRFSLINVFCFLTFVSFAQPSFKKDYSIQTDADLLSADVLGNTYVVRGSEVVKYNQKGVQCCTFSDRNYGVISSIDTRDPLRVLLFYKPFGVVRLLDNKLTEQATINLSSVNISDPLLVCSSDLQGLWVYDNATSRLYKFNSKLQAIGLSNDLRQDVMQNISPIIMSESDYWLVILEKQNLLVFDKMGNYFKSIHLGTHKGGQLIHDDWIYNNSENLMRLNLRNGSTSEIALPFSLINSKIILAPQIMLHLKEKTLDVYSY